MKPWSRIGFVFLIVAAASTLQVTLWSLISPSPWFLLLPAIFFSSLVDGLRGSIIATFLTTLCGIYFFIPPEYSFHFQDKTYFFSVGAFILLGLLTGFISDRILTLEQRLRKRNEELSDTVDSLRLSEQKIKYHLENSPMGVIEWDTRYIVTQWSKEAERIFGWSAAETIGKSINSLNMVYKEDLPILERTMQRLSGGKELTVVSSNRNYTKEGRIIECTWYNSVLLGIGGEMLSVMSLVEDITERKKNIIGLQESERALREARQKLDIALENANIGLWKWNVDKDEVFLDDRAAKIFGFRSAAQGKASRYIERFINEEDVEHLRLAITATIEDESPFATILRLRKGKKFINLRGFISKENGENERFISGVCFDVTELKKGTEKLIDKLNEDLLRSNNDLQQFAYAASHDLQEPLRMVSSFTQLLQHRYQDKLDRNANEYIRFAVEGSKRMYELLNGLLSYSRVQTKGREFSKVDMNLVVSQVIDVYNLRIRETGAEIRYGNLPVLFADENQMIQLMQNLIDNSLKFRKDVPVIEITSLRKGINDIISIKDNGIGIDPKFNDKVFRIFQKLHSPEEFTGTGIGLAICKRIVERHSGKIWIESQPGGGATFRFSIPRLKGLSYLERGVQATN